MANTNNNRNGNPFFAEQRVYAEKAFAQEGLYMTVDTTIRNIFFAFAFMMLGASITWYRFSSLIYAVDIFGQYQPLWAREPFLIQSLVGCGILGMILGYTTCFKPAWAPYTTIPYAFVQGVFLSALTILFEIKYYASIGRQALLATGVIFGTVLFVKTQRLFVISQGLRRKLYTILLALFLLSIVNRVLSWLGINNPVSNAIHGHGLIGIGFSIFVIGLGAFLLLDDMQRIEEASKYGLPAYMNWYLAFGLFVTLIWIYVRVLELLAKLADRKK